VKEGAMRSLYTLLLVLGTLYMASSRDSLSNTEKCQMVLDNIRPYLLQYASNYALSTYSNCLINSIQIKQFKAHMTEYC